MSTSSCPGVDCRLTTANGCLRALNFLFPLRHCPPIFRAKFRDAMKKNGTFRPGTSQYLGKKVGSPLQTGRKRQYRFKILGALYLQSGHHQQPYQKARKRTGDFFVIKNSSTDQWESKTLPAFCLYSSVPAACAAQGIHENALLWIDGTNQKKITGGGSLSAGQCRDPGGSPTGGEKTQCLPPVWLNLALYQITAEISPGTTMNTVHQNLYHAFSGFFY